MTKSLVEFDGFGVVGSVLPEHVEKYGESWASIGAAIGADKKRAKSALTRQKSAAAIVAGITKQRAEEYITICEQVGYVSGKYNDQTQPVNVFLNACEMVLGIKRSSISTAAARIREERNPALKEKRKAENDQRKLEKAQELVAELAPEVTLPDPLAADVAHVFSVVSNLWDGLVTRHNAGDATVYGTIRKPLVDLTLDMANVMSDADLANLADAVNALVEGRSKVEKSA